MSLKPKYNLGQPIVHPTYGLRTVAAIGLIKTKEFSEITGGKAQIAYQVNYGGLADEGGDTRWYPESFFEDSTEIFSKGALKDDPKSAALLKTIMSYANK
jgi:hypothetical protein